MRMVLGKRRLVWLRIAGNCHKWLCSPRGAGFLYARPERRIRDFPPLELQPPAVSHGYNTEGPQLNRYHDAFDFQGTIDPTPWLCVGRAIDFLESLMGEMDALMEHNRRLATAGADLLMDRVGSRFPVKRDCSTSCCTAPGSRTIAAGLLFENIEAHDDTSILRRAAREAVRAKLRRLLVDCLPARSVKSQSPFCR